MLYIPCLEFQFCIHYVQLLFEKKWLPEISKGGQDSGKGGLSRLFPLQLPPVQSKDSETVRATLSILGPWVNGSKCHCEGTAKKQTPKGTKWMRTASISRGYEVLGSNLMCIIVQGKAWEEKHVTVPLGPDGMTSPNFLTLGHLSLPQ